jgi:hypothetical protein
MLPWDTIQRAAYESASHLVLSSVYPLRWQPLPPRRGWCTPIDSIAMAHRDLIKRQCRLLLYYYSTLRTKPRKLRYQCFLIRTG